LSATTLWGQIGFVAPAREPRVNERRCNWKVPEPGRSSPGLP